MNALVLRVSVFVLVALLAGTANAVNMETVPVGNPGNAADSTGYGSVGYTYNIGKYEVTAGQYTEFLNNTAATDTYGLYNMNMWASTNGCKIQQSGSSGSYTYSVAPDYANRPVNYVSWGDSARFANWLHNNQPTGAQGLSTTEDGAYYLNGATTDAQLLAVNREADRKWAITSEDEWYKAAYYDPATSSYFNYATSSNTINTSMANYGMSVGHTTDVGSYGNSSPYGTFDQDGNVWEWNEAVVNGSTVHPLTRGMRGGSFDHRLGLGMRRGGLYGDYGPSYENSDVGFRVSEVPEPCSAVLLLVGTVGVLRRRSRG